MRAKNRSSSAARDAWKYQYQPLDPSQDSIRLLRLIPSDQSPGVIRCNLFHTTLSEAPPYVALSYTWGARAKSRKVRINDGVVAVTLNLEHALKRLQSEYDEGVALWIDAICINQEDIQERNVQIGKMRVIYQNAESVAVWLGFEQSGTGVALQLVRDLNACTSSRRGSLIRDPARAKHLEDLVLLFRRQYWWRIWVIQEVSSARNAIVYCGPLAISWSELDSACEIFKEEEAVIKEIFYTRPSYCRTLTHGGPRSLMLSRFSPNHDSPPLLELLLSHKSKKSTDPKDKVFALVGISSSRSTFGPIDYSASLREIYTHTVRHIITTSMRLEVICAKQNDYSQHNLPSWVPNWVRPSRDLGALPIGLHYYEPAFAAAGNSIAQFEFPGDGYTLEASGFIVDTIMAAGAPFKQKGPTGNVGPALVTFHEWWDLYAEHTPDSNSTAAQAAFCRAISCGNWNFDENAGIYEEKLKALDDLLYSSTSSSMTSSASSVVDQNENEPFPEDAENKEGVASIVNASIMMNRRRLFLSKSGLVGLARFDAIEGDIVAILFGCRFPVVLRRDKGCYKLIGEAYVDKFMNGEGMVGLEEAKFYSETFQLT